MVTKSKRHNTVVVNITYQAINDRSAFADELDFIQDLTTLMVATKAIHEWGDDPIVRPNAYLKDPENYYARIDLKFPIHTRIEGEDGELKNYSYSGLHAVLCELGRICADYSGKFVDFSANLDLEGMKAPWILPVKGQGVIMREGSHQIDYSGAMLPLTATIGAQQTEITQLMVVGEPRAVNKFNGLLRRITHSAGYPLAERGPNLDVSFWKDTCPDMGWQNIGIFACFKDAIGNYHWEQLGDMHNAKSEEYIHFVGNHMLSTPLPFTNTSEIVGNNIFLNDHAYYAFQSAI